MFLAAAPRRTFRISVVAVATKSSTPMAPTAKMSSTTTTTTATTETPAAGTAKTVHTADTTKGEPPAVMHQVFVYGTLKSGEPNYSVLTDKSNGSARLVGNGRSVRQFPLLIASSFNIPYLLYKPGTGHRVHGEVYAVDDKMLAALDDLENHPSYYVREQDAVELAGGCIVQAWIYFLKEFRDELLEKPLIDNYSSTGPHGLVYVPRYLRNRQDPTHEHYRQVKPQKS